VILVDTSVWVDHLRNRDKTLSDLLDAGEVLSHPFLIGELALGRLNRRELVLSALRDLPRAEEPTPREALRFVEEGRLFGRGIGYIDVHLLAAVRLTAGAGLWTRHRRLHAVAKKLGVTSLPTGH
jgi:hypothetical protein